MNNAKFCEFVFCYFHLFEKNASIRVRGSSYGGELVRFDRLAHLSEISSSLRNSYKNIMCSYEKWASQPKLDITSFCQDPTKVRWKFSKWTRTSGPTQQGGIEFWLITFGFFFRLNKYKNICSAWMDQTFVVICFLRL